MESGDKSNVTVSRPFPRKLTTNSFQTQNLSCASCSKTAEIVGVDRRTVARCLARKGIQNRKTVTVNARRHDDVTISRCIWILNSNQKKTMKEVRDIYRIAYGCEAPSIWCMFKYRKVFMKKYSLMRVPSLNPSHKQKRLDYIYGYNKDLMDKTLYTDEKWFYLQRLQCGRWSAGVYAFDKKTRHRYVKETKNKSKVQLWAGISRKGCTPPRHHAWQC